MEGLAAGLDELAALQARLDEALPQNTLPPELLQHYNQQLEKLVEAEGQRVRALTMLGLPPEGMPAALMACPDLDLAPLWEAIREKLPLIALNNRKHAQVLHKATASIHTALGLLGILPAQPPLYGPSGQRQTASTGRPLGSA